MRRYAHQTGGTMVYVEAPPAQVAQGDLVQFGALVGLCASNNHGQLVLRIGGQVAGPVKGPGDSPPKTGDLVYLVKDEFTTVAPKGGSPAGVLLSSGSHPRILLKEIAA